MTARQLTSPSSSRGFTLVEVMMAMLILTVGLVGLLQSIQVAYLHNARNKVREEAVQLAEEQMNDLKSLSYDRVTANHTIKVDRTFSGGKRKFLVATRCQEVGRNDAGPARSKRVTVGVGWVFNSMTTWHEIYGIKTD
ncbi:MAG TPA: prepilin-type N-terminal cleavage/methylation domain-containing protein [Geomonas sp.]|nr:prepilin-type N-terminal cleavage/methylation domain-containing protein [Geomonas sp.]